MIVEYPGGALGWILYPQVALMLVADPVHNIDPSGQGESHSGLQRILGESSIRVVHFRVMYK